MLRKHILEQFNNVFKIKIKENKPQFLFGSHLQFVSLKIQSLCCWRRKRMTDPLDPSKIQSDSESIQSIYYRWSLPIVSIFYVTCTLSYKVQEGQRSMCYPTVQKGVGWWGTSIQHFERNRLQNPEHSEDLSLRFSVSC